MIFPVLPEKQILFAFLAIIFFSFSSSVISQETKPAKISKITFNGNNYFSNNQLLNMIISKQGSPYTNEQFDLDLRNIIKNYQQSGYLDCKITGRQSEYNFDSTGI